MDTGKVYPAEVTPSKGEPPEMWKLIRDLEGARKLLAREKEKTQKDQGVIKGLVAHIRKIKKDMANHNTTQ